MRHRCRSAVLGVVTTAALLLPCGALSARAQTCTGDPGPCDGARSPQPAQTCIGDPGPCDGARQATPIVVPAGTVLRPVNGPRGDYDGQPVQDEHLPVADRSAAYEARLAAEFCVVKPELC